VVDAQPGQKRKRTATRLQLANEAKRKELEVNGDAFSNYRPPPRPPIKAPDVQVKQIVDVSIEGCILVNTLTAYLALIQQEQQG
jgi:dual-specificity kinase